MSTQYTDAIRSAALAHHCVYTTEITPSDRAEGSKTTTVYSLRNLVVIEEGGAVQVGLRSTFVELKRLFDTADDPVVREILFNTTRACTHCISDKCTTLLMAPKRTLVLDGRSKTACSMWGQWISMPVNDDNLASCVKIVEHYLAAAEAAGEKHADVRWSAEGLDRMLSLKLARLNHQWEHLWPYLKSA